MEPCRNALGEMFLEPNTLNETPGTTTFCYRISQEPETAAECKMLMRNL